MTGLIVTFTIVAVLGVVCVASASFFSMRDRDFRAKSRRLDAYITGYTQNSDGRYHTQYRMLADGTEIFGVLPESSAQPILPQGEVIELRVHVDDPTRVMPPRSRQFYSLRTFLYLLGIIMVLTATPLLLIAT